MMNPKQITNKNISIGSYIISLINSKTILFAFARRNVLGKIAQTRLGVFIILIQAILLTLFMGFIINKAISFEINSPYLLFLIPGMCGWYVFSYLVTFSGMSLIQHQGIITRVAFPRIILPFSFGISIIVDIIAWMAVIIFTMIYYKFFPSLTLAYLPLFIVANIVTGLAIGLWLAILSVKNRDFVLISPLIIGFGIFFTPVFYPVSILPEWISSFLHFNPLAGIVEGYRYCFLSSPFDISYLWGFLISFILFISGIFMFSKKEGLIADYL